MSTQAISRPTPYQLVAAIEEMVMRYGRAERRRAYQAERRAMRQPFDADELDRQERACRRRYAAIQRLTEALRKQADA